MVTRMRTNRSPKRPRVLTKCVADAYVRGDERIVEFSFPARASGDGNLPGGLIRFHNRPTQSRPLVEVYRTEGQVDVIAPRRTYWAAYSGMPRYGTNGITLHTTERAALEEVAEGAEVQFNDPDDPQQVRTNDELRDALGDVEGLDWCVEEVEVP